MCLLLVALVSLAVASPPWARKSAGGKDSSDEDGAEMSPKAIMAKLKLLIGVESQLREKTEEMIDEKGDLDDIQKDFIRYHNFRKQFAVAQAVNDKKDLLKEAFQHFVDKVKQAKGEQDEERGKPSWGYGGKSRRPSGYEEPEEPQIGGVDREEVDEKVKLLFMWKLFVEFETAWLQQNNIVALDLDEKTTRALFFETFGRFVKNAMAIKEKAEEVDKFHDFVQESQQKAKHEGLKEQFKKFIQQIGSQSDN